MSLRYATFVAVCAGLSLAAAVFNAPRLAVTMLVLSVLMLAAAVEALRHRVDHPEKRP